MWRVVDDRCVRVAGPPAGQWAERCACAGVQGDCEEVLNVGTKSRFTILHPCICFTSKTKKNMPILVAFTIDVRICRYWYLAQEKTKVQIIDQLLSQLNMIWFGLILTVKTAFFLCNIKFRSLQKLKKIVKFRAYLFSSSKMQQLGKYEFKPCVGSYVAIRKFRINRS